MAPVNPPDPDVRRLSRKAVGVVARRPRTKGDRKAPPGYYVSPVAREHIRSICKHFGIGKEEDVL